MEKEEKVLYSVRFPPKDAEMLERMSDTMGITKAELIRKSINLYKLVKDAENEGKDLVLENKDGTVKERVRIV